MEDRYEVSDGARGTLYGEHQLRNAKIAASRRSRVGCWVHVSDTVTKEKIASYYMGKRRDES